MSFDADPAAGFLRLTVRDDGCGMSPDLLSRVTDPFVTTRTTRSIGLGLPLFKEQCELTGGKLLLTSALGAGTTLTAELGLNHVDRLPLGNLGETWKTQIMADPAKDYCLILRAPDREMILDTIELRQRLDDVPLDEPDVLQWVGDFVAEQQQLIFGGVLNEIIS